MADSLHDLLRSRLVPSGVGPRSPDALVSSYTSRLCSLSAAALTSTEPEALDHESHSSLRSLQALAKRSYKSINASAESLSRLQSTLPQVASSAQTLQSSLPGLEESSFSFSQKYGKPSENPVLNRRRKAMLLSENVERVSDILEIPTLLSSIVSTSATAGIGSTTGSASSATANYASALDLYAHTKRLQRLHPESNLIRSIADQAEDAMKGLAVNLIAALRSQSLKLAAAMRLVSLLRRVAPELDDPAGSPSKTWTSNEGSFGALFLVCRLANLTTMLDALEPLRELADQETVDRKARSSQNPARDDPNAWAGQQTERYLKRYIEVFREQCFAIVSMCKSVFSIGGEPTTATDTQVASAKLPTMPAGTGAQPGPEDIEAEDAIQKLPSTLSTFIFHLVEMLMETLGEYLPNVQDQSSRNSLLTQVLYCASSLGRHGGDFGMMLALLQEETDEDSQSPDDRDSDAMTTQPQEWIEVMKRHRVQASRLELLASGVGTKSQGISTKETASPS